jgi:hypothetical protein
MCVWSRFLGHIHMIRILQSCACDWDVHEPSLSSYIYTTYSFRLGVSHILVSYNKVINVTVINQFYQIYLMEVIFMINLRLMPSDESYDKDKTRHNCSCSPTPSWLLLLTPSPLGRGFYGMTHRIHYRCTHINAVFN